MPEARQQQHECPATDFDVVVVGAGFGGVYAAYKMRELGFSVRVLERGTDVGGTWYWNRYPGARCDAPSMQYSYQFSDELQQEWKWSEVYAPQPEILRYLKHVVERFNLRELMQFETNVLRASYEDDAGTWAIETDRGETFRARFCIMATGCLSSRNVPSFPGLEEFQGTYFHTGDWPREGVDFSGKRVGLIGTGSTGIQATPVIARESAHLYVFQRTPQFTVPARNAPMDPEYEQTIKTNYRAYRARNYRNPVAMDLTLDPTRPKTFEVSEEERRAVYDRCWERGGITFWLAFRDSSTNPEAGEDIARYMRSKIREIVNDPETAAALMPDHLYGCKRPCIDTDYYETFNRDNVTLVDIRGAGVEQLTARGVLAGGKEYEVDYLVFATGFDAMTGSLNRIDIRGQGGQTLKEKWAEGPIAYLGLSTSGFPNLFTVTGPGSPSVLANMVTAIEQHVNFIADCMVHMRENGHETVEVAPEVEEPWLMRVRQTAERTLFTACDNWYQGDNIPGKPRVFMPYPDWPGYVAKCEEVVENDYEGFVLR
ncbi:MAG: NAD(P)/FAD-dependent oxidoreductase [Myxococcales bacterium]|nr:NAD(P)/FAD-dependent oxidoreductase [Myxococcales bacterium]